MDRRGGAQRQQGRDPAEHLSDASSQAKAPEAEPPAQALVLRMQRAAGNGAVSSVLGGSGGGPGGGGGRGILVGAPDTSQERNADQVARAFASRLEGSPAAGGPAVVGAGGPAGVQRAPLAGPSMPAPTQGGAETGTPLGGPLEGQLTSRLGGGRALDRSFASSFGEATGADLSGVRVHDSGYSHDLSRALGARAFTFGRDVFFGQGQYSTASRSGRELIAHELTHVAQGGGGIGRQVIHRALTTNGGTWDTQKYGTVTDGAEIELKFQPNNTVNATKIGLVQRSKKVEKGVNFDVSARSDYLAGSKTQMPAQKRKAQRSDGESHIDRDIKRNNPVYGAPDLQKNEELSATPMGKLDMSEKAQRAGTANNYQLGYRTKKGLLFKSWETRDAKLYDKPNLPGATTAVGSDGTKTSEMTFETTALAIDGPQKGTYYGSVSWGFNINDASGSVLQPLAVASLGDPTAKMQQVMQNWNQGEFEEGKPNPQLPIPGQAH